MSNTMPESSDLPVVSVVLPTYNEKGNIEKLIPALQKHMRWPAEFIVVDDDSPDGTGEAVAALQPDNHDIRLIVRRRERGLVSAIQRGINESRGQVIVWMDCDFSLPPEKVPELVAQVIEGRQDVAVGSRYVPGGCDETEGLSGPLIFMQKICTNILNRFTQLIMRTRFHDWTSGFIAIRADIIKEIPLEGDYGEYFILLMARLIHDQRRWVEVPYRNVPRTVGESKTADSLAGLAGRGVNYLFHIFRAWRLKNRRH